MSVQLTESFALYAALPLDERAQYSSIADMAAVPDFKLYDGALATIKGDTTHTVYQWWSDNLKTADFGRWQELKTGGQGSALTTKELTSRVNVGGIEYGTKIPKGTEMTEFIEMLLSKDAVFPMIELEINMSDGEVPCPPGPYVKGETLVGGTFNIKPTIDSSVNRVMHHIDYYYQGKTDATPTYNGRLLAADVQTSNWIYYYTGLSLTTDFKLIAKVYYTGSDVEPYTEVEYVGEYRFVDAAYYGVLNNTTFAQADIIALDKVALDTVEFTWKDVVSNDQVPIYAYPTSRGKLASIKDVNGFEMISSFNYVIVRIGTINYYVYYHSIKTTLDDGFTFRFS